MTAAHSIDFEHIQISDEQMRERIAAARSYTLVLLSAGPGYTSEEARAIIWEHGRRNMRMQDAGIMRIVCPVRDDTPLCGVGILDADLPTADRLLADDPGVQAGVFSYELHPVSGFAGSTL
ncbi:hypothetical protein CLV47_113102 [Antricoccus suffuscus]|uniref:YCII-related domain-containing protein n=1 Tax=Antricoccus suffuscus TaxID=1629062 RepID=A0A2T0ZX56_9ACTN|nr:hypothetical protein [Antricoccus suffuscus]PRZ40936.1 hypothetical protein CLV47_113102 [Antricoccus suffuscus]